MVSEVQCHASLLGRWEQHARGNCMHVGTVCTWELYSHAQLRGKIAEDIILGVCYKAILFVKSDSVIAGQS